MSNEKLLNILVTSRTMLADHGHVTICQALTEAIKGVTLKITEGQDPISQQESATVAEMDVQKAIYFLDNWRNMSERIHDTPDLTAALHTAIKALKAQLEQSHPAPSQPVELDWDRLAEKAHSAFFYPNAADFGHIGKLAQKSWKITAKAVVAAYEAAKKGGASGD